MGKYDKLNTFILENIGGDDNIIALTHCVTRLRFTLKNNDIVNKDNLISHPDIMTAQVSNGQYQVVVGMQVGDIYNELLPKLSIGSNVDLSKNSTPSKPDEKTLLNKFIDIITKIITPTLGVLLACSLILGLQSILTALNVIKPGDGAYIIFNSIGNALFTFFPIILGYTSAKAFKSNGFIGMIVGASLVFPNILSDLTKGEILYTLFSGTMFETAVHSTFFGIPIIFPETGYTSTVIPIILTMFFLSKFERFLNSKISKSLQFTFVPFLTILVGVPATILLFGPIANTASNLITGAILSLYSFSSTFTALIVGIAYTPLVILGLHWPLVAIGINNLAIQGFDYLLPMIYTAPLAQLAVVFAVYLKTKKKATKEICIPSMISAFFCIIEPAIYGITLPVKKRFAFTCIGTATGAVIIGASRVCNYASTIGVLGIGGFINPSNGDISNLIVAVIASCACMVVSFLLTFFSFSKNEEI